MTTDARRNNRGTPGNRGGAPVRKITLTRDAAQKLKILTLNRRSIIGNQFSAVDMVESLICVAYGEYDSMVSEVSEFYKGGETHELPTGQTDCSPIDRTNTTLVRRAR